MENSINVPSSVFRRMRKTLFPFLVKLVIEPVKNRTFRWYRLLFPPTALRWRDDIFRLGYRACENTERTVFSLKIEVACAFNRIVYTDIAINM